ncbi:hypothetical protein [Paenibacillus sp. HJGM_3]|uniref:hypothetical protein n=1 Tax=Paenibacillus sp. HJGM_3 TaxID=3379816 RepID=UPI0038590EDE
MTPIDNRTPSRLHEDFANQIRTKYTSGSRRGLAFPHLVLLKNRHGGWVHFQKERIVERHVLHSGRGTGTVHPAIEIADLRAFTFGGFQAVIPKDRDRSTVSLVMRKPTEIFTVGVSGLGHANATTPTRDTAGNRFSYVPGKDQSNPRQTALFTSQRLFTSNRYLTMPPTIHPVSLMSPFQGSRDVAKVQSKAEPIRNLPEAGQGQPAAEPLRNPAIQAWSTSFTKYQVLSSGRTIWETPAGNRVNFFSKLRLRLSETILNSATGRYAGTPAGGSDQAPAAVAEGLVRAGRLPAANPVDFPEIRRGTASFTYAKSRETQPPASLKHEELSPERFAKDELVARTSVPAWPDPMPPEAVRTPAIDIRRLSEEVYQVLERKLTIERQRKGL